jgi:hypothetical protein
LTKNGTKLLAHCSSPPEDFSYLQRRLRSQHDLPERAAISLY